MTTDRIGARQKSIANQKLIRILSIGFCISLILHIIAIAGISYLSNINTEEELEITTIERIELEPEPEAVPSIEPITSISKSTASTSSASPAKTAFNTSEKSNFNQFTTTAPKTPQSKPQQSIVTKNSKSTRSKKSSPIVLAPTKKSSKSNNRPKDRNKVSQPTNRSIQDARNQKLPSELDDNFSSIDNTPIIRRDNIGEQYKNKPQNNNPKNNKQAISRSNGNNPAPGKQIESDANSPKQSDSNTNLGSNDGTSQNNSSSASIGNNNNNPGNGNGSGSNSNGSGKPNGNSATGNNNSNGSGSNDSSSDKPNGNSTGNNNDKSATQCLRNCSIKYPDEFQNSDVGKGKISIRVTIDGDGIVTAAEIVRSSENKGLDSFALEAIKKMQFNATGETRIRKIKVNTISNN